MTPKTHFIGIEELPMMAIASALHKQGHTITTCRTVNKIANELLPEFRQQNALHPNDASAVDVNYDAVIVGQNVNKDHEQVMQLQQLGVPVYFYPAYLQKYAKDKQRILVIGKDEMLAKFFTILIHVMHYWKRTLNYVAFVSDHSMEVAVHLSDAPIIFFQGDLCCFSPLDPRNLASIYQPHVVVMIDIPAMKDTDNTYSQNITTLQDIADAIPKAGRLIYNKGIIELCEIGSINRIDVESVPFAPHTYEFTNKKNKAGTTVQTKDIPVSLMDKTSLQVLSSVCAVLAGCAVTYTQFHEAIQTYR